MWRGPIVTHVKYLATKLRTVMIMKHFKASKQINEIMNISESYLCKTNSCYTWISAIKLLVYVTETESA